MCTVDLFMVCTFKSSKKHESYFHPLFAISANEEGMEALVDPRINVIGMHELQIPIVSISVPH